MLQNMTIATYVILQNKVTIANTILTNTKKTFFWLQILYISAFQHSSWAMDQNYTDETGNRYKRYQQTALTKYQHSALT
jgi:hypothetical protein